MPLPIPRTTLEETKVLAYVFGPATGALIFDTRLGISWFCAATFVLLFTKKEPSYINLVILTILWTAACLAAVLSATTKF